MVVMLGRGETRDYYRGFLDGYDAALVVYEELFKSLRLISPRWSHFLERVLSTSKDARSDLESIRNGLFGK